MWIVIINRCGVFSSDLVKRSAGLTLNHLVSNYSGPIHTPYSTVGGGVLFIG